jgi:hypothetical protein
MDVTLWLLALIKAVVTASLVVFSSAVAEALGPFWGALIIGLPVVTGPTYAFLALQHGRDFLAASALSSFAANAATGLFLIVYGVLARKMPPWTCLGTAVLTWFAASLTTHAFMWTPETALLLNLAVYGSGFVLLKSVRNAESRLTPLAQRRWFALPVRAIAVGSFVSLVVAVSSILGSNATGIAAVFPVGFISLIVIVRPRIGGEASSQLAAHALRSMLGFGMMLLALHLAIRPFGATKALVVALLVSISWSVGLLLLRRRRQLKWRSASYGKFLS